jgi:hypothetical protein
MENKVLVYVVFVFRIVEKKAQVSAIPEVFGFGSCICNSNLAISTGIFSRIILVSPTDFIELHLFVE